MNMLILLIASLVYAILLMVVYFSKRHINTKENKIYKKLIILNLLGILIDISCVITTNFYNSVPNLCNILCRMLLVYYIGFIMMYTYYVLIVCQNKTDVVLNLEVRKKICIITFVISSIVVICLPMKFYNSMEYVYTYGPAIQFLTIFLLFVMIFWFILLLRNIKRIREKKYLSIILFIVLAVLGGIVQNIFPQILITTSIETFITFLMYFTIENPDVKILNEVYKNKELMEQNYEDKYNFLFEITQEARAPLIKISSLCNEINKENDPNKIKLGISIIDNLVKQLDFSINNVLNISSMDIQKLRFIDSKYDLGKMCNELVLRISNNIVENVEFKYEFPKASPILYGDNMKLKQILYSLLINSAKYTKKGYIEFKVSILERYDVCRVIYTISDTGSGMNIEQINDILSATGELDKQELENLEKQEYNIKLCQKIIKIMGGNLLIKADADKGTEIKLVIDQKIYHEIGNSILDQYENVISNYKKILIVSQDNKLIRTIRNKCNQNNISYITLLYGIDAIDRIKANNNYDYILISDEMKKMSGLATFHEMKKVNNFKIPVLVMLSKDKENIKDDYLNEGFSDYILIDKIDSELDRIMNKY